MDIKGFLKRTFDSVSDFVTRRGPFDPAPEVRAKLEAKGYTYQFYSASAGHAIAAGNVVFSPKGENVSGWPGKSAATAQYHDDYAKAVEECRLAALPAPTPGEPFPPPVDTPRPRK